MLVEFQRRAVDAIKRHALALSLGSPRAEAQILTEYLWAEEGSESSALQNAAAAESAPPWLGKLVTAQLADEARHARLLRERLADLGREGRPIPAIAKAKLWWLERACAPYEKLFAAGPIVMMLAVAARLEATGVRVFDRHLGVLEHGGDPLADTIRSIVADERRHAKSCAAAARKLLAPGEEVLLDELDAKIAEVDRAFGVTLAVGYWVTIAARVMRDRVEVRS